MKSLDDMVMPQVHDFLEQVKAGKSVNQIVKKEKKKLVKKQK